MQCTCVRARCEPRSSACMHVVFVKGYYLDYNDKAERLCCKLFIVSCTLTALVQIARSIGLALVVARSMLRRRLEASSRSALCLATPRISRCFRCCHWATCPRQSVPSLHQRSRTRSNQQQVPSNRRPLGKRSNRSQNPMSRLLHQTRRRRAPPDPSGQSQQQT